MVRAAGEMNQSPRHTSVEGEDEDRVGLFIFLTPLLFVYFFSNPFLNSDT